MVFVFTIISIACVLASIALGIYVEKHDDIPVDVAAQELLFGHFRPFAHQCTNLGYSPALSGIFIVLVAGYKLVAVPLYVTALLIIFQLFSQSLANAMKRHFKRMRPARWLVKQEHTAAYPSGHATTAIVVFGGLACVIGTTGPNHILLRMAETLLLCTALAIGWSRIALGAHHLTDVIGGYILGTGTLCAMIAVYLGVVH